MKGMFNAFLLMIVIHANQIGVGILGFQRSVFRYADHDAWISVVLMCAAAHVVAWMMLQTLKLNGSTDLFHVHKQLFGKWLGTLLSLLFLVYILSTPLIVVRSYIEVVQTWIFPDYPVWMLSASLFLLTIYGVLGGIRPIVGVCLFSAISHLWLVLVMYIPLTHANWQDLLPVMEGSGMDLLQGALRMAYTLSGFEVIYFLLPMIKEKKQAGKYLQLGLLLTDVLYIFTMLAAVVYFSPQELLKNIWATLSMLKIVQFPFLERFEFVAIPLWMLVILPHLLMHVWIASRGLKWHFGWSQRKLVFVICTILFGCSLLLKNRYVINEVAEVEELVTQYVLFVYPVFLYLAALLRSKWLRQEELA